MKKNLNLKDRIFDHPNCNVKLDRDYNASLIFIELRYQLLE
ncbi:hypothetical protein QMK15_06170 [Campylobacter jejuni]|nr:hypothetical protein QMK15_06170 [Campylobacter jejuni]